MKRINKVLFIALLTLCAALISPLPANATSVSQSSAVAWAQSKVGSGLDYDGAYGNQCVDFIYYYYSYLGVSPVGGNACDYSSNALPSGWTRISSNITPQPGDIAVWKSYYNDGVYSTGWAGHISVVVSGNSSTFNTIHQNFNGYTTCIQSNNIPTAILACVIRPNFSSTSSGVTLSWSEYADKHSIGTQNATLARRCDVSGASTAAVSKVGIYLYDYNGKQLDSFSETVNLGNYSYFTLWYDINSELGYTLAAGTTYKYKFVAVVGGDTYYSPVYAFQTKGAHSHSYDSGKETTKATCTAQGARTYTCTTCGNTKNESISATGHSYGSWSVTTAATCTKAGTQKRACLKCSNVESAAISELGHNYSSSWTVDKAATCTTTGSKSHHCTRCSSLKDVTIISALGHTWSEWIVTAQPTVTSTGQQERICSNGCGAKETHVIAKLEQDRHDHIYGNWTVVTEPNCTDAGVQQKQCTICEEIVQKSISATGHNFNDWEAVSVPSCTQSGTKQRQCKNCSQQEQQGIEATGHNYGQWEESDIQGVQERICKNCGNVETITISIENPPSANSAPTTVPSEKDTENQDVKGVPPTWFVIAICSVVLLPITTAVVFKLLKRKKQ